MPKTSEKVCCHGFRGLDLQTTALLVKDSTPMVHFSQLEQYRLAGDPLLDSDELHLSCHKQSFPFPSAAAAAAETLRNTNCICTCRTKMFLIVNRLFANKREQNKTNPLSGPCFESIVLTEPDRTSSFFFSFFKLKHHVNHCEKGTLSFH